MQGSNVCLLSCICMIVELFVLLSGVVSALAAFLPEVPLPVVFLPVVFLQKAGHCPGCISTTTILFLSLFSLGLFFIMPQRRDGGAEISHDTLRWSMCCDCCTAKAPEWLPHSPSLILKCVFPGFEFFSRHMLPLLHNPLGRFLFRFIFRFI